MLELWEEAYHQQPKDLKTAKVRGQRAVHILKLEEFGVVKEIDAASYHGKVIEFR